MEILDQDMQMVRDFLNANDAPEYIKGHFENLVSEHAELAERVERLEAEESKEIESLRDERDALQDELDDIAGDGMRGVLTDIKYWLHDALIFKRLTTDPMQMLRKVEDVLL